MTTNSTTMKTPSARASAAEISAAGFPVHFECTNCGTLFGARHGLAHCCNQPVTEFDAGRADDQSQQPGSY